MVGVVTWGNLSLRLLKLRRRGEKNILSKERSKNESRICSRLPRKLNGPGQAKLVESWPDVLVWSSEKVVDLLCEYKSFGVLVNKERLGLKKKKKKKVPQVGQAHAFQEEAESA